MSLPVQFATLAAGNQLLSLFDTQFAAVAALGCIPCAAGAGPNNITLTPLANTPAITSYLDLAPSFIFVAAATSTAQVNLNVAGVGSRPAYRQNGLTPINGSNASDFNNVLSTGGVYRATPLQALNSGAGGFIVDLIGPILSRVSFIIDGGGNPITTGQKGQITIPFSGTVVAWHIMGDQSGSIVVDVLRANDAVPTTSMIGSGNKPTLSSGQFAEAGASGWTSTAIAFNDWLAFNVTSASTVTRVTVALDILH